MVTRRKLINRGALGAAAIAVTSTLIGYSKKVSAQDDSIIGGFAMTENTRQSGTIDRLYALNGGFAVAPDRSVYSPEKRSRANKLSYPAMLI